MFYVIEHSQVCYITDENMICAYGETLDETPKSIENDTREAMNRYKLNEMVANPETFKEKIRAKHFN